MNDEPGRAEKILAALLTIVYLVIMASQLIPEHQRKLFAMKATKALSEAAAALASHQGRQAMRRELRGARGAYELPAALSGLRDRCRGLYEALRAS